MIDINLSDFTWKLEFEMHKLYYLEHPNFIGFVDVDSKNDLYFGHSFIAEDIHYFSKLDSDIDVVKYDLLVHTAILLKDYLSNPSSIYWK
jgi:hypothetical protein